MMRKDIENHDTSEFVQRHIGPDKSEIAHMLATLGVDSLDDLIRDVIPAEILDQSDLKLANGIGEAQALAELAEIAADNQQKKSLIGQGYYGCHTPAVLQRNVFENPAWYTSYTPYQPEISQGRLEVLFNFQTLVTELTGMAIANASLLDEATAVAEAMAMAHRHHRGKRQRLVLAPGCHRQTIDIIHTRAQPLNIEVAPVTTPAADVEQLKQEGLLDDNCFAVLFQYPETEGGVSDLAAACELASEKGALVIVATDLLALTLLPPPSDFGADIVVGNSQRFGVPMGFGGPHAAFMATTDKLKRSMPGRLVGESVDSHGNKAYRLALQTREQHIRREKATSNICTAQALLAIMATLYACYHGPAGLQQIARRVHNRACLLQKTLQAAGLTCGSKVIFDTVAVQVPDADAVIKRACDAGYNLRKVSMDRVAISLDETCTLGDLESVASAITEQNVTLGFADIEQLNTADSGANSCESGALPIASRRSTRFMTQACFNQYHSETEMMRYLRKLSDRDIALDRAMIPLGSCTMKLNAAAEMMPVSWSAFSNVHPFTPPEQVGGYHRMITEVEQMLCACTGYAAVSLQPNAGSQGEFAGLLAIARYHQSRGENDRDICLIPSSAHGTNPASAQMAGMQVIVVNCDDCGNIDLDDLQQKLDQYSSRVAAIMITYPSTHGVFEVHVRDVCDRVHAVGGQVYIDGANLNALVGVAQPGVFGGDVSHLNLHKTFCIPHGGGGPGVGPVAVAEHLAPYLPGHFQLDEPNGAVSAAPFGSASILPITWMYIRMMGYRGLRAATRTAILNANYIARRLSAAYPVLYTGHNGFVAHECIIDTRGLKESAGISVDDIAKRLIDYGFHAPTMSFPVAGTLMIEPTESESLIEIDRFCDAMLSIFEEIQSVQNGDYTRSDNPLVNAPHTAECLLDEQWEHCYTRKIAAYPAGTAATLDSPAPAKYWPPVGRIDNVYGDKNLVCSCPPLSDYRLDEVTDPVLQASG